MCLSEIAVNLFNLNWQMCLPNRLSIPASTGEPVLSFSSCRSVMLTLVNLTSAMRGIDSLWKLSNATKEIISFSPRKPVVNYFLTPFHWNFPIKNFSKKKKISNQNKISGFNELLNVCICRLKWFRTICKILGEEILLFSSSFSFIHCTSFNHLFNQHLLVHLADNFLFPQISHCLLGERWWQISVHIMKVNSGLKERPWTRREVHT